MTMTLSGTPDGKLVVMQLDVIKNEDELGNHKVAPKLLQLREIDSISSKTKQFGLALFEDAQFKQLSVYPEMHKNFQDLLQTDEIVLHPSVHRSGLYEICSTKATEPSKSTHKTHSREAHLSIEVSPLNEDQMILSGMIMAVHYSNLLKAERHEDEHPTDCCIIL